MNLKLALTAIVSVSAGLALGFVLFHRELPALPGAVTALPPPSTPKPVVIEAPRPTAPGVAPSPSPPPAAAAPLPPTNPGAASAPPLVEPTPAVAVLETKVQELERQLAVERAMRKGTEGEAIAPPANLAPRFRDEQQLLTTFNAALKAAGFPGQVSNIDCTEHPCIVFGTGFGERGDMEKLKGQLGAYEHDSFSTYGFGTGDGKKEHRFFGVAVMPESKGPPDEAVQKRITFRVNQMHEASKPPPTPKP